MEKPPIKTVIEKLKEADIKEWEVIRNLSIPYSPYFELKRQGLVFRIETARVECTHPMLSIEDHDKNVQILYNKLLKESDEVYKLYNELLKKIEQYEEKDTTEKLGFLLSEEDLKGSDLERIITRLKELDARAWKPDPPFGTTKYPMLVTKGSGVTFCITKGIILGYGLEVKYEKESTKPIKYTKPDKKHARKLIGELYEKVYKELKEDKEKDFGEKLNHFLTD